MARLAIRATGDKSQRINTTTGEDCIRIEVIVGNRVLRYLKINSIGDVLQRHMQDGVVYWHTYTRNVHEKSETHSA
jgi:hypothetical protein